MRTPRLPVVLLFLASSVLVPACGGDDPTSPDSGCITLDKSAGSVQNNQDGVVIVHGTFGEGAQVRVTLDQNGVIYGNGLPILGTKVAGENWVRFNNIPPGTYNATWYGNCGSNTSPNHIDGPSIIVVTH